jgi:hypothetical protein
MSRGDSIEYGNIYRGMKLRSLSEVHFKGVPLYRLPNGARFRFFYAAEGVFYSFVKHAEHRFPAHFLAQTDLIVYQYKVGLPTSSAYKVIFVKENEIVELLEIP